MSISISMAILIKLHYSFICMAYSMLDMEKQMINRVKIDLGIEIVMKDLGTKRHNIFRDRMNKNL